jgi:hypothetical protein
LDKKIKYDLVIPLSSGSIWENNEVRYCIRSIVKNFDQLGKIYIIGQKPEFLNWDNPRLIHVEYEDYVRHNKDANLINKVLEVCKRKDLSDDFIRSSDDQVLLKKIDINGFYPRYLMNLNGKAFPKNNNSWFKRLKYTVDLLQSEGKTMYHYESHYPMLYNKQYFIDIMKNHVLDVTINTYYFNHILDEHKELENIKIVFQKPLVNIQEFLVNVKYKIFLGYNNKGLREPSLLKQWLQNEFKEKSEFEI